MPPSARSFNWMSSFGSSLGSDFCLSRRRHCLYWIFLSSFSSRSSDFLWCLCVCRVEGNFSHFSFWLHERKEKMYADFFFFFSWREKIVLVLLLLFGSSRRNWDFFSSQLTPTVITVFSHRKVACYLHKQKNKSSEFFLLWQEQSARSDSCSLSKKWKVNWTDSKHIRRHFSHFDERIFLWTELKVFEKLFEAANDRKVSWKLCSAPVCVICFWKGETLWTQ